MLIAVIVRNISMLASILKNYFLAKIFVIREMKIQGMCPARVLKAL